MRSLSATMVKHPLDALNRSIFMVLAKPKSNKTAASATRTRDLESAIGGGGEAIAFNRAASSSCSEHHQESTASMTKPRKGPLRYQNGNSNTNKGNDDDDEVAAGQQTSFLEIDNLLESIAAADGEGTDHHHHHHAHRRRGGNNNPVTTSNTRPNYSTAYGRSLYHGRNNGNNSSRKSVPLKRRHPPNYHNRPGCDNCLSEISPACGVKLLGAGLLFFLLVLIRLSFDERLSPNPKQALERFRTRFKPQGGGVVDESESMEDLPLRSKHQESPVEQQQIRITDHPRARQSKQSESTGKEPSLALSNEIHDNQKQNQQNIAPPQHWRDSLGDVSEPFNKLHDVPFFFHIPRSGGTTLSDIMTHCLQLVTASNIGITEGRGELPTLQVNTYRDQGQYVNVDTSTPAGITRARELGLAQSGLAQVITSHRFLEATQLFDLTHRGRAFGVLRHPVDRAVSMFYYLQMAKWEPTYDPDLATMSLEDYAVSPKAESNWLTRTLTDKFTGGLTEQHVTTAKEIIRRKVLIGLMEKFDESMKRFEIYFGWWDDIVGKDFARVIQCHESRKSNLSSRNEVTHPMPQKESTAYQLLSQRNWADVIIYDYAVEIFREQEALVRTNRREGRTRV